MVMAVAVGAEAEIGGVAKGQHAGVAEQEIERHGGERHKTRTRLPSSV